MKYEFKPFSYASYLSDLSEGWKLTYRIAEEYPHASPRDAEVVDLGEKANWQYRLASIDLSEGGTVHHHDIQGRYDSKGGPCCLDLILYREVGPKPREVQGMAYAHPSGKVVSVVFEDTDGPVIAAELHTIPCTITLHEPA